MVTARNGISLGSSIAACVDEVAQLTTLKHGMGRLRSMRNLNWQQKKPPATCGSHIQSPSSPHE
jgi:hypothetical protein